MWLEQPTPIWSTEQVACPIYYIRPPFCEDTAETIERYTVQRGQSSKSVQQSGHEFVSRNPYQELCKDGAKFLGIENLL